MKNLPILPSTWLKMLMILIILMNGISLVMADHSNFYRKYSNEGIHQMDQFSSDSIKSTRKDPFFGVGIFAGLNFASGYYDFTAALAPPLPSLLIGPSVGLDFDWRFSRYFSIRSQLAYRQRGDNIDMAKWYDKIEPPATTGNWIPVEIIAEGNIVTRVGYADINLIPSIHISRYFFLGFGGYASIGLHGFEKTDFLLSYLLEGSEFDREEVNGQRNIGFVDLVGLPDNENTRYFNRLDYGLTGMLGFGHRPLTLDLGVSYGLATWQPSETLFSANPNPDQTHHLSVVLSMTLWFR